MSDRLHATREELLSMSGLDFVRGMLDGSMPRPPIADEMNYRLTHVAEGEAAFTGAPTSVHTNPMGGIHGGWYGTLLDSALGCAVMTVVPKGSLYTTLEYKINITRALRPGVETVTTAWVDHAGRSTATAHGEMRGVEDGKLYATGSTTCFIMKA